MRHLSFTIVLLLFACGGSSSSFRGYVGAEHTPTPISSVVVAVSGGGQLLSSELEEYAAEQFSAAGIAIYKFDQIVPPIRAYTAEEFQSLLAKTGADAVYLFRILSHSENRRTALVGGSSYGSAECSEMFGRLHCDGFYTASGPRTKEVSNPTGQYEAALYRLPDGALIWGGVGAAQDTRREDAQGLIGMFNTLAMSDLKDLAQMTIRDSVADLGAKGFIRQ